MDAGRDAGTDAGPDAGPDACTPTTWYRDADEDGRELTAEEEAGAEARYLKDSLDQMIGVPCYLDVSNLADLRELFASGVHVSEVFVLLLTGGGWYFWLPMI